MYTPSFMMLCTQQHVQHTLFMEEGKLISVYFTPLFSDVLFMENHLVPIRHCLLTYATQSCYLFYATV